MNDHPRGTDGKFLPRGGTGTRERRGGLSNRGSHDTGEGALVDREVEEPYEPPARKRIVAGLLRSDRA